MTLAVAEACLAWRETKDIEKFRGELVTQMQRLGRKYPNAGYGRSFRGWLRSDDPKPYNSFGNGSAN